MTEAPELDVTWVRSLEEASALPRVRFDGALYEASKPEEVEEAAALIHRWGQGAHLLVSLPKDFEDDAERLLEQGAEAVLFVDSAKTGPGFVSEVARALDLLHEQRAPKCNLSRPPSSTLTSGLTSDLASASSPDCAPAPLPPPQPPAPPSPEPRAAAEVIPFVPPTDAWHPQQAISSIASSTPETAADAVEDETPRVVSASDAMAEVAELVDLAASSPSTVLLTGETGVGKEVIARQLHARSCREDEPFVAINCAAFPESLLESELFGHLKGAFTGADRAKTGLFEAAGRGTLFLDEIAEMELPLQAKLLRVLQEREIRPVGGTEATPIHCRMVAATNRILADEVAAGHFREDLFYRLNVFPIRIPPLRERRTDILPLARYFLALHGPREGKRGCHLSLASAQLLESYSWPGNVRELENEILRVLMLTPSHQLATPKSLSAKIVEVLEPVAQGSRPDESLREALERVERWLIRRALANNGGRKARTARKLGLTREGLYKKIKRLGIE
ncbi:MAG: sigma-54 interaction domain-containing protein [Myxococcota bacterium]